jgi:hypothetical protein
MPNSTYVTTIGITKSNPAMIKHHKLYLAMYSVYYDRKYPIKKILSRIGGYCIPN